MSKQLAFEDIELNTKVRFGSYKLTADEIISFAKKWDPQTFHIDEELAKDSIFGGVTACSSHLISICALIMHSNPMPVQLLAGLGMDELRLLLPARPDDELSVQTSYLEKRPSESKPDRGIVLLQVELLNQRDEVVLTNVGKLMVARKEAN